MMTKNGFDTVYAGAIKEQEVKLAMQADQAVKRFNLHRDLERCNDDIAQLRIEMRAAWDSTQFDVWQGLQRECAILELRAAYITERLRNV